MNAMARNTIAGAPVRWAPAALAALLLLPAAPARALDAALLAGTADAVAVDETSYAWQIDFRHDFERPFAASASWINEGHYRYHHRDGLAGQLWGRIPLRNDRMSIAFGAGAYRYFDTRPQPGGGHNNAHGTAPIYGLSASWQGESPWFFRITANHIHPPGAFDTNTFLAGVGYRLGRGDADRPGAPRRAGEPPRADTGAELLPFLGVVVRNDLESRPGAAAGVEYRKGLARNLDWTLSWIYENSPGGIRRSGIGGQMWLVDAYARRRVVLGLGAGLYAFYDANPPGETHSRADAAGLVTLSAGYRFGERWIARFNWSRTMTGNDRDTDIFVLGAGCRWND